MFNNTVGALLHVDNGVVIPPLGPERAQELGVGPVSYRTTFYNGLGYPVTVVDRNGLRFTIPPNETASCKNQFVIRQEITVTPEQWGTVDRILAGIPNDIYANLNKFRDVWNAQRQRATRSIYTNRTRVVTLDYVLESSVFFDHASVYHRGQDLLLSRLDAESAPPHPYHPDAAGALDRFGSDDDKDPSANLALQMELIEGEEPLAPRYLAISNRVFLVRPKKDNRREPGLYLTHLERDPNDLTRTRSVQEKYSISEMESVLNMYRTQEEALAAGDLKASRQEKIAELTHQTELLKRQAEAERQAREAERASMEADYRQREHDNRMALLAKESNNAMLKAENKALQETLERERQIQKEFYARRDVDREAQSLELKNRLERESQARKEYYDERQHVRKDRYDETSTQRKESSDWIKFLPIAIVGIGAAAAAIMKWFSD